MRIRSALAGAAALAPLLVLVLFAAIALSFATPNTPLSPALAAVSTRASQQLYQDWRLFSPELSTSNLDTTVSLRSDESVSPEYSIHKLAFNASLRGWRRLLPSRLWRVLETGEIYLSQAIRRDALLYELQTKAAQGSVDAKRTLMDPRIRHAGTRQQRT